MFKKGDARTIEMAKKGQAALRNPANPKRRPILKTEMKALGLPLPKHEQGASQEAVTPPVGSVPQVEPVGSTNSLGSSAPIFETEQKPTPKLDFASSSSKPKMSLPPSAPGYCLMSIESLNNFVAKHLKCAFCGNASSCAITESKKVIMAFGFLVTCQVCGGSIDLPSSPYIPGKNMLEVNLLFFSACMAGGLGKQSMNSFLSPFCHPPVPNNSWEGGRQLMETLVSEAWAKIDDENLVKELVKMKEENGWEKDKNGRVKLEVTFDGTWSTRGYSSLLGFATYFGVYSQAPLFTSFRCKVCRLCQAAEARGVSPRKHDCPKNWCQSSGAMEADMAVEGAKKLARKVIVGGEEVDVRVGVLVGDGDSKIDTRLKEMLPENLREIERYLDTNHIVKNFTKRLYKLKKKKFLPIG